LKNHAASETGAAVTSRRRARQKYARIVCKPSHPRGGEPRLTGLDLNHRPVRLEVLYRVSLPLYW